MITQTTIQTVERFLRPAVESGIIPPTEFDAIVEAMKPRKTRAITMDNFCERLSISRQTCWRMIRDGRVGSFKVGRSVRIPETEVDRILEGAEA